MKKSILFCGTPKFAVTALKSVHNYQKELNYELKGVLTIPDRIAGRGHKKHESAIKKEAKKLRLTIYEPTNLEDDILIKKIESLQLDLIIVVAFKKLPKKLFSIPKYGTINLHASLLPKYRGAAPINWALINGEKKTGLTTFFINEKIDTGDIILQQNFDIDINWHADDLHDFLMTKNDKIIYNTIKLILLKKTRTKEQKNISIPKKKYAPKIYKEDRLIDSHFLKKNKIKKVYDFIRGMSPPGVKTTIIIENKLEKVSKKIIITRVGNYQKHVNKQPTDTELIIEKNQHIKVYNNTGSFHIQKLKVESGKEYLSKDFINGFLKKDFVKILIK